MQPPPRKSNYAKFLKTLHSEQVTKLQAKNQHECDLLEDIRNFTLKRSAIEKSYSEALLKISSAFLNKKIPNIPDIKTEGSEEKWNMWNVWRTVLEENEKLARARLAAVEVFHQQIADDAKFLRSNKVQTAKKSVDQIVVIQKELQTCVQDVDKTKKFYFDEEHTAHDVRDKARDIEEKLKKKKGSFFQSITSLQKNSAKVTSKREALEEKSTGARNDYLLSLASANAHQTRYFVVDLQSTMQTMESCVFEKVAEYLTLIGRTELLTCSATQNSFGRIRDQAQQLTREYNLQCLYLFYPVLKQHIQYEFEPCDNDTISRITAEHPSVVQSLSKEAKRWATRISRENINAREYTRRLQVFQGLRDSGQKVDPNDQNGPDLEMKIEELKHNIRRSETAKMKAEARIECLRQGGVNVDEWLQDVDNLSVQDMQRSASALSVRTDASGAGEAPSSDSLYDSDFDVGSEVTPMERPDSVELVRDEETDRQDAAEVDAMVEQERQRLEQLTAGWDDPTQVDWGHTEEESFTQATAATVGSDTDADSLQQQTPGAAPDTPGMDIVLSYKCIALYNYTSQNPDELSIVENEQLEVIGEGDGDGWLRARNYRGEEGYVPHNYLDVDQESGTQQSGSSFQLVSQISFSSVDYTVDETDEAITEVEVGAMPSDEPSPQHHPGDNGASYCVALYDYEATCLEELMFTEGQVIRVLRKVVHDDVDDGWWEGELDGRTGLFPSLVVEECHADGEPITPQDDDDAPSSAPPVFTPPDIPSFMLAPQQVIITQATPMGEHPDSDKTAPVEKSSSPTSTEQAGFSMELSRGHYRHYDAQFGEDDVPTITVVEAPTICIDEDGEEDVPSIQINLDQEAGGSSEGGEQQEPDFGLGVAQIVITAATPMVEEPEQPFPPPPTEEEQEQGGRETQSEHQEQDDTTSEEPPPYEEAATLPEEIDDPADDLPTDSAPFPISSSTGSEEDTYTGPSTAENSQSHPLPPPPDQEGYPGLGLEPREKEVGPELREKKAGPEPQKKEGAEPQEEEQIQTVMTRVEGGRGSIPDELEPHQLAQLQDLKESNA